MKYAAARFTGYWKEEERRNNILLPQLVISTNGRNLLLNKNLLLAKFANMMQRISLSFLVRNDIYN